MGQPGTTSLPGTPGSSLLLAAAPPASTCAAAGLDVRACVTSLPPGLCDVVMRAMARDPSQRFANMRDLVAALEPYWRMPMSMHAPSQHPVAVSRDGSRDAAEPGELPPTPLFSESISSTAPASLSRVRAQYWLAGIFGVGLLGAFAAAIVSRPDTTALRVPVTAAAELKPAAAEVDPPELHPNTIRLAPDPSAAQGAPVVQEGQQLDAGGVAKPEVTAPETEAPARPVRVSAPRASEPQPARTTRKSVAAKPTQQQSGIRPRVALDRDDFGAN